MAIPHFIQSFDASTARLAATAAPVVIASAATELSIA